MQLSPTWTLLGNAVLKLQQKGTHDPLLQYCDPTHYFNHKCRIFSDMPSMWCSGTLQEGLPNREEWRWNRRSLTSEWKKGKEGPYYNMGSLPIVSFMYAFKIFKTSATRVIYFARSRQSRGPSCCVYLPFVVYHVRRNSLVVNLKHCNSVKSCIFVFFL